MENYTLVGRHWSGIRFHTLEDRLHIIMPGIEGPDDIIHFRDHFAGSTADLFQGLLQVIRPRLLVIDFSYLAVNRNTTKGGSYIIMKVLCNFITDSLQF